MEKIIFTLVFLIFLTNSYGQLSEKKYVSVWGDTWWEFEFTKDNKYKRTSSGHYGNTVVKGRYTIKGDTIILSSGYKNTHGTVNKYYLIDGDSCIIDMNLKYDYCTTNLIERIEDTIVWFTYLPSRKRQMYYPDIPTTDTNKINEMENILQQVLEWPSLNIYFHNNLDSSRIPLIIQEYFEIKKDNNINLVKFNKAVTFMSEKKINSYQISSYLKIDDISINPELITVELKYNIEGIWIYAYFYKVNGEWKLSKESRIIEI